MNIQVIIFAISWFPINLINLLADCIELGWAYTFSKDSCHISIIFISPDFWPYIFLVFFLSEAISFIATFAPLIGRSWHTWDKCLCEIKSRVISILYFCFPKKLFLNERLLFSIEGRRGVNFLFKWKGFELRYQICILHPPIIIIVSCPGQLNRWPCHSVSQWRFSFSNFWALHRAVVDKCDLSDNW